MNYKFSIQKHAGGWAVVFSGTTEVVSVKNYPQVCPTLTYAMFVMKTLETSNQVAPPKSLERRVSNVSQ